MGLYHRSQRRLCSEKGKNTSIVKNRKREGTRVCKESVEKGVYLTIEIITSILCVEEG